ncbi:uncharacterized protein GGS22DRAFT_198010 [Annulohypoxylon maeteangense]|uniref:uncharacterized protein n=1 Tax=Annulohypoxylon maeteangense TaxID=1927788 RepID=UPI00200820C4|nr:uncharacterized protein GGS22DRAFT_198010 [Annulohypoxylon maeteangense]KAI0888130.1 hypothetical protein GGS22DRAFT_198010 [Annulohypoxylon maeteangense]
MASPSTPQKPSVEERDCYYFGLSGQPKLIARTSCDPWVKPIIVEAEGWNGPIQRPARKKYSTIGANSAIALKWSSDLIAENFYGNKIFTTLKWKFGKVAVTISLPQRSFESLVDLTRSLRQFNRILRPLLSYPGNPVSYYDGRLGQGTMGLYVKLRGDESIYGLTCRHVVCADRPAKDSYKFSEESEPQYHVQANTRTFQDCQYLTGNRIEYLEGKTKFLSLKKQRWDDYYHLDESKAHLRFDDGDLSDLKSRADDLAYGKRFVEPLERLEDKSARKIGQLMFHSSMEFPTHQEGYLKDWALIKLDEDKFSESPKNSIFVGGQRPEESPIEGPNIIMAFPDEEKDQNEFMRLKQCCYDMNSQRTVFKVGATSGLTVGQKNEVEAVVRKPKDLEGCPYARQVVIITAMGRFSDKGDSGSCVFDERGRIVGLLTSSDNEGVWPSDGRRIYPGGNMLPRLVPTDKGKLEKIDDGTDITFADPIQWVFDDIERLTSRKVEVV